MAEKQGKKPRKLTPRQTAVLAAVERLGRPTMLELSPELDAAPSAIAKVLGALEQRGLIAHAGDPGLIYTGGVRFWATNSTPDERRVLLDGLLQAVLEDFEVEMDAWVDADQGCVVVALPLDVIGEDLREGTSPSYWALQSALFMQWQAGSLERVEVAPELSNPRGEPAIRVKLTPNPGPEFRPPENP